MYEIYPVIDEMKCDKTKLSDSNSLMGLEQASSTSFRPLQAIDDKPNLGFVSLPPTPPNPSPPPHPLLRPVPITCYASMTGLFYIKGSMQFLGERRLSFHTQ